MVSENKNDLDYYNKSFKDGCSKVIQYSIKSELNKLSMANFMYNFKNYLYNFHLLINRA